MQPVVATVPTASNVLDRWKMAHLLLTSRGGASLELATGLLSRHRSQALGTVRACGFRVLALLFTLLAVYGASLSTCIRSEACPLSCLKPHVAKRKLRPVLLRVLAICQKG